MKGLSISLPNHLKVSSFKQLKGKGLYHSLFFISLILLKDCLHVGLINKDL